MAIPSSYTAEPCQHPGNKSSGGGRDPGLISRQCSSAQSSPREETWAVAFAARSFIQAEAAAALTWEAG